jgi:type III secretion protein R
MDFIDQLPDPIAIASFLFLVGLAPFAVTMLTSFVKIAVVLFLVRTALGIQQTPPNIVLYGVALTLTAFIMAPVGAEAAARIAQSGLDINNISVWPRAFELALEPIRGFLIRFVQQEERQFFMDSVSVVWPENSLLTVGDDDIIILLPAFLVGELGRAFEIGFMLFLPMVVIDLIVANILMAMGMMMVSPMMISLPFKLLLFVAADGWTLLLHGLVTSYGI